MTALIAAAAFAAALDVSAVRTPYARVRIPAAVDPGPDGNYPSLRVVDDRGDEVPYVVVPPPDGVVVPVASAGTIVPADAPATQRALVHVRTPHLRLASVRFDVATPAFSRDVTIEASDDGETWSSVLNARIRRFPGGVADLGVALPFEEAAWYRVTIDNRDDAPLAGVRISLLAEPRDAVFPLARPRRYALRFGDPNAAAPSYDLRDRLEHERWRAGRVAVGPVAVLGRAQPVPVAPAPTVARRTARAEAPAWVISLAFTAAILALAAFAMRLARAPAAASRED